MIRPHIVKLGVLTALFPLFMGLGSAVTRAQENVDEQSVAGVSELSESEEALLDPNLYIGIEEAYELNMKLKPEKHVKGEEIPTLFFTLWQHQLLQEAKQFAFTANPAKPSRFEEEVLPKEKRAKGLRELSLGGILHFASDNWIVWLNGQRVTPEAIPNEVIDIKVNEDFIELRWFDEYSNLIFPIRLRPHQRFNLDSRIFLPGSPS